MKRVVRIIIISLVVIAFTVFTISASRIQITPSDFNNTKWISTEPDIYFEVPDDGTPEGYLNINGKTIRIFFNHVGKCVRIYDADKDEREENYNDESLILAGTGHWGIGKYIVDIDNDYIGIGTTKIVFYKEKLEN